MAFRIRGFARFIRTLNLISRANQADFQASFSCLGTTVINTFDWGFQRTIIHLSALVFVFDTQSVFALNGGTQVTAVGKLSIGVNFFTFFVRLSASTGLFAFNWGAKWTTVGSRALTCLTGTGSDLTQIRFTSRALRFHQWALA
jgi:hypothetical protein